MKKTLIVEKNEEMRLDAYIVSNLAEISRMAVKRLLEEGKVLVNGRTSKASYKPSKNDKIEIQIDKPKEIELEAQEIPIQIIYEDKDIIVVNKPKGLVVHPANGNPDGTLVNAIMAICKDSLSGIGGEIRPGIVHRLDKDTSGLLIVAKNDVAHIKMSEQIKNRQVKKTYIALVRGSYTLLEIKIETGRTHQIRVHMAEIGYPVIGDSVYSNGKNEFKVEGQCLHAQKLQFRHPITGKEMNLEAPLPEYFTKILEELENLY